MLKVLDQHQLDDLVCSSCHKYLSVLPIKQFGKGIIKCGRCCKPEDKGVGSVYNNLADFFLFKCVNSYSGCRQLLKVSEVLLHEEKCFSESYICPTCSQVVNGSYQLIHHYKNKHRRHLFFNNISRFLDTIDFITNNNFVYIVRNFVFVVYISFFPNRDTLEVCASSLKDYGNILYKIKVDIPNGQGHETGFQACLSMTSTNERCFSTIHFENKIASRIRIELVVDSLDAHDSMYEINYKREKKEIKKRYTNPQQNLRQLGGTSSNKLIELTSEFKNLYPEYELSPGGTALISFRGRGNVIHLVCSNCKHFMGPNVYYCTGNSHLVCCDCKAWCGACDSAIGGRKNDISIMFQYILFSCRWKCSKRICGKDLRKHEQFCSSNRKICPECLKVFPSCFLLEHIKRHFTLKQGYYFTNCFNFANFLKYMQNLGYRKTVAYFVQNYRLVSIKCEIHGVYRKSYKEQIIITYKPEENFKTGEFCIIIDAKARHNLINVAYVNKETDVKFYFKF